jgi:hypothetical protein
VTVFVLSSGRSGTRTFAMACRHITDFTSVHELRIGTLGPERLA